MKRRKMWGGNVTTHFEVKKIVKRKNEEGSTRPELKGLAIRDATLT